MTTITAPRQRASLSVLIAAWAVPVLVLGGFALISGAAIGVVLYQSLRDSRLRWFAAALAAVYVVPVTLWLTGPSTAPSLTKFLSPAATIGIAATGVVVAIAHHVLGRRR